MTKQNTALLVLLGNTLVQIFDIMIHAFADELEPLRVASNLVILLWIFLSFRSTPQSTPYWGGYLAVGLYLVLNVIFIALNGVTNLNQGGAFRTVLFILVGLTCALSLWTIRSGGQPSDQS